MSKAGEALFSVNLNDGGTLVMKGNKNVKQNEMVIANAGMTKMVLLYGGAEAHLLTSFISFQNGGRSYSIRGVPDTVPDFCYRRGPRGRIKLRIFEKFYPKSVPCRRHRAEDRGDYTLKMHLGTTNASCGESSFQNPDEVDVSTGKYNRRLCQQTDLFIIQNIMSV